MLFIQTGRVVSVLISFPPLTRIHNLTSVIVHDKLTCVDYHETHYRVYCSILGAIGLLFLYLVNETQQ